MAAAAAIAFVFGLVIGSFLNVVAWRLPRGESLVHPPSACPNCGTPIKPYDNVPVLSWLLLRGRCRSCGHPISPRYPLVELATGLLYAAVVLAKDEAVDIALGLLLVTALVPIVLIDLEHRLIPNKITLPAAIAASSRSSSSTRASSSRRSSRAPRPAASSSWPRSCIRAGWAWGTSSSPVCSASTSGVRWGPRCSPR
jgi:hypothetical protein